MTPINDMTKEQINRYWLFMRRGHGHSVYIDEVCAPSIEGAFEEMKTRYLMLFNDPQISEFYVCTSEGKYRQHGRTK
jgi:hypothetical protein